jgi:UDP-glucose 4-epimerase
MRYTGKRALVTGGLGFIGSNLSIRLVEEGADVTVVDSSVAGCGANRFNLDPVKDQVRVISADIGEGATFRAALSKCDVVFNLAGEISHIHSMQFPERDLQINTVAQLRFLLECASAAPGVRVVYASTRQIYGVPDYLPVDEKHPIQPVDFNGVHKYAASMYHRMLSRTGQIDAGVLKLTNIYGPRMALDIPCQGFLSTYLRRLVLEQPLAVYGDGRQLRDPVYVDDAVEAFLRAGLARPLTTRSYNVGGATPLSLREIATLAARAAGGVEIIDLPFPEEIKPIDIGSFTTDSSRIAADLGWRAQVSFEEGMAQTMEYYRKNLEHYLDPDHPEPACDMPEHSGETWRLTYAAV